MTRLQLPQALETLRPRLGAIVEGIERRAPYGAVLLTAQQGLSIDLTSREEQVSEPMMLPSAGTILTAFDGHTLHERAVHGFGVKEVERAARDLVEGVGFSQGGLIDPGPNRQGDFQAAMALDPATMSLQDKLDRCRDIRRRLQALDDRIVDARVRYVELGHHAVFCNRAADLAQRIERLRLFVFVTVKGEDGVRVNWHSKSISGGWERLGFSDEELRLVVDHALALLTAERIEPGEYTVVASPGVAGTICHESFGHGVETDMFLKGRAKAAGYLNKVVASPLVDIFDDPSNRDGYAGYYFDDEGMLAAPTKIVDRGMFRRGITDLYSATALGIPRTANGRRQDYRRKAYPRMTTTYFGPGSTPVDQLIGQVERGVYLQKWYSGMEDPQGWGIQVTCHYGREIKSGKVTERVFSPIGMTGYVPDVLQSIQAVGDDLSLDGGICGKGHKEYVPSTAGGPHLLLKARLG
jgi:TldD protein